LSLWEEALKLEVTYSDEEFNKAFTTALKNTCKSLIPEAQTFYIIRQDILSALPETYEYAFAFDHDGEMYDFSFKGSSGKFEDYQMRHFDVDRIGSAKTGYTPVITVSQNGQIVLEPYVELDVLFLLI
jgi:hypothetical protein